MNKDTAKMMLIIGIALILLALLIGPTSTTTTTECTDSFGRQPPQCYDATVTESNPFFFIFMGIGGLLSGPAFWWLVIRSAVKSGTEANQQ